MLNCVKRPDRGNFTVHHSKHGHSKEIKENTDTQKKRILLYLFQLRFIGSN